MAVQNKSKGILNMNSLENSKNKVYINPNFNMSRINNHLSSPAMHVNPKFSQFVAAKSQSNIQNKNKIYINPNFIKSRSVGDGNQCISSSVNNHVISDVQSPVSNSLNTHQHQSEYKEASALPPPFTQSRYSLVRQNVTNKPTNETPLDKTKYTFKLNKYKTVSWKDIKINLANVKIVNNLKRFETNFQTPMNGKVSTSFVLNRKNNQYKLTNYNNASLKTQDKIKTTKLYIDALKKMHQSNQANQSRLKKMKGSLKKNNIPCPLFRKFGTCLRNARGKCEFLHDRKHVSICRKFIKGLCHDKDCLLSHDLTTKKMPTCYFYLQGSCTKAECPYLHVKLNEKTKICPDFVKGYCEKGSKCLQRHVNIPAESKKPISQIRDSFRKKYNESRICQGVMKKKYRQAAEDYHKIEKPSVNSTKSFSAKGETSSENRYYDEHRDDGNTNESFETIKPMRCKLGTLPSFIQL